MAEVKWIKITTNMFEDEKIDFIQSLPESDAILVIWIRILTLAGKCNAGGYIYLTENIPYTPDMLAHKFRKPVNIINLALETFKRLQMIQSDEKGFYLPNWSKHQNIDGLDKIREQNRLRVAKHRENTKLLPSNVTSNVTVTQSNATDIDKELDKDIYKYMSDSNEYRLAEYLYNYMLKNNDKCKKPNFQSWSKHFDYILRIDERDIEEVKAVIKFSQTDNFWSTNILSAAKLREKYDQLLLKMKQTQPIKSKQEQQIQPKCKTVD